MVGDDGVSAAASGDVPAVAEADAGRCVGAAGEAPGEAPVEASEDLGGGVEGCGVGAYVDGADAVGGPGGEDVGSAAWAGAKAGSDRGRLGVIGGCGAGPPRGGHRGPLKGCEGVAKRSVKGCA